MKIIGGLSKTAETVWLRTAQPVKTADSAKKTDSIDHTARRFDSVTISQESGFLQEMRSVLTQEVRTAPSRAGDALIREIQQGTYRPDPMETARKMLLLGGDSV